MQHIFTDLNTTTLFELDQIFTHVKVYENLLIYKLLFTTHI